MSDIYKGKRLWFIQILRAISCLIVIYFHIFEAYWLAQNQIADTLNIAKANVYKLPHIIYNPHKFALGSFAVSIFFLISGFVIAFSLFSINSYKFLIQRIFRIYPVLIVSVTLTCFTSYLSSLYLGREYQYSLYDWIGNVTLVSSMLKLPLIEYSVWTLVIEVIFYITCAFIFRHHRLQNIRTIIKFTMISSIVFICKNIFLKYYSFNYESNIGIAINIFLFNLPFIIFMLIGTCFYFSYQNKSNNHINIIAGIFCYVIFILLIHLGQYKSKNYIFIIPYSFGILFFSLFYHFRDKIKFNRFLNFIAEISYPLYLNNFVFGYIILTLLYDLSNMAYLSLLIVSVIIVSVSRIINIYIENPFNRFGKKITK